MGLPRTVSEINGDFSQKIANISQPLVFCTPAEEVTLALGIGAWVEKTRVIVILGGTRSLTISDAVWIQSTNVTIQSTNMMDGQTGGHRTTAKTALTHSVARTMTSAYMAVTVHKLLTEADHRKSQRH